MSDLEPLFLVWGTWSKPKPSEKTTTLKPKCCQTQNGKLEVSMEGCKLYPLHLLSNKIHLQQLNDERFSSSKTSLILPTFHLDALVLLSVNEGI